MGKAPFHSTVYTGKLDYVAKSKKTTKVSIKICPNIMSEYYVRIFCPNIMSEYFVGILCPIRASIMMSFFL